MWTRAMAMAKTSLRQEGWKESRHLLKWMSGGWRELKVSGIDLRAGNVIEHAGKVMQVVSSQYTQGMARAVGHVQAELKDIKTGNKVQQRFRSDEKVERLSLEHKKYDYLYDEGSSVVLMDPETFEQIHLDKKVLGNKAVFLVDSMPVTVMFVGSDPVMAAIPEKVTLQVMETEPPMKHAQANPGYKPAVLENGVKVQVPHFVATGNSIVVNTEDLSFQKRAK